MLIIILISVNLSREIFKSLPDHLTPPRETQSRYKAVRISLAFWTSSGQGLCDRYLGKTSRCFSQVGGLLACIIPLLLWNSVLLDPVLIYLPSVCHYFWSQIFKTVVIIPEASVCWMLVVCQTMNFSMALLSPTPHKGIAFSCALQESNESERGYSHITTSGMVIFMFKLVDLMPSG